MEGSRGGAGSERVVDGGVLSRAQISGTWASDAASHLLFSFRPAFLDQPPHHVGHVLAAGGAVEFHAEVQRFVDVAVDGAAGLADDDERWLVPASGRPIEGTSLGIGVDDQDLALPGKNSGHVQGERRLSDSPVTHRSQLPRREMHLFRGIP